MEVPTGVTFGSKVAVIPGYASGFTHSGDVVSLMKNENYRWVTRGEPIAEFQIHGSCGDNFISRWLSSETHSVQIKCPVSGLLLHSTLKHELSQYLENWNSMKEPPRADFAVLLPDDEPPMETSEYIYSSMCRLIRDMKHYYLKKSRYWSMSAFSPERLEALIEEQLSAQPIVFDALPTWNDYLNEARTKQPELRPYLKHLVQN